jgi:NAD-dependent DNA ligase
MIRKITNFINRLKISYLSYDGVIALYELKQIRKYSDIFNLEGLRLSSIPNFGMKKANRVKEEISILKERRVSEPELLYALSIDNLGPKAAELICSKFHIRDLLYRSNYEFLYESIPLLRGYNIDFSFLQKQSKDIEKVINILL